MTNYARRIWDKCFDEWDHDMNDVASFMVNFFESLNRHQGRMMRKWQCVVAKMCAYKVMKEYNRLAVKHVELAKKYNELVDKYNELKHSKEDSDAV